LLGSGAPEAAVPFDTAPFDTEPTLTRTYPTPSAADGHATFTQSPTLRVTASLAPRATWPITGLAVLGALCTLADDALTVSSVPWAVTHDGLNNRTMTTAAA
jgi:hypothetical protein